MMNQHEITFSVTHCLRPKDLDRCLTSIKRFHPKAKVHIQDTFGNLSQARNRLVRRCRTPYYFMLEEDMRIMPSTDIGQMKAILDSNDDYLGVSGIMRQRKQMIGIAGIFTKNSKGLRLSNSLDVREMNGHRFIDCQKTLNWGLFKTDRLRQYQWNESLEIYEHIEFFWNVLQRGVHRMACSDSVILHHRSRPNEEYNAMRGRKLFKTMERRLLGRVKGIKGGTGPRGWNAAEVLLGQDMHVQVRVKKTQEAARKTFMERKRANT